MVFDSGISGLFHLHVCSIMQNVSIPLQQRRLNNLIKPGPPIFHFKDQTVIKEQ